MLAGPHVSSPIDSGFDIKVVGTGDGGYALDVVFDEEDGTTIAFTATEIPTAINTIHQYIIDWPALSQGETAVTLLVDYEGDGVFDKSATADSELTAEKFVLQTETIAAVMDFDPNTLNDMDSIRLKKLVKLTTIL